MPKMRDRAWMDRLMVSLSRKWGKVPLRHMRLKEQLAVNRGKALGYPKPYPPTKQARKDREKMTGRRGLF